MRTTLLLLTAIACFPNWVFGFGDHVLSVGQARTELDSSYYYWRDPSAQQTINEIIRRQYDPRWTLAVNSPPNFQYTFDAVWLKFELASTQTDDQDYMLELGSPYLDDIEVHHVKRNHFGDLYIAASFRAGDDRTIVSQKSRYRLPVFPIRVEPQTTEFIYVKIHSKSAINLSVALWQRDFYIPEEQKVQAFYGFFFGLMVVMAFYNLVVWLFIREPMYLCYVFYAMSVVFYQASVSGFGALYLWGNVAWLLDKGLVISSSLSFIFGALFVWHFLAINTLSQFYQKAVTTTLWVFSCLFLASLVLPESTLAPVGQIAGIIVCIAMLVIGGLLAAQHHEMARYFVVAWGVLLIGTVVYTLAMAGVIPRTPLTIYMQPVGMALEVMLLAVAMALRVNQERDARKKAVDTALELSQKVNAMNAEKLMLYSEDNQVLEEQSVEQNEQLSEMRYELDKVKERLDSITQAKPVEGMANSATLKESSQSNPEPGNIVNIERGRKDS